jgi:glutamine synthetase
VSAVFPARLRAAAVDPPHDRAALDALEADRQLTDVLGGYFVVSFVTYKRNQIERFVRFVTDWEFREHAYHL